MKHKHKPAVDGITDTMREALGHVDQFRRYPKTWRTGMLLKLSQLGLVEEDGSYWVLSRKGKAVLGGR